MATTPYYALTLLEQSQAQKEITVNQALSALDSIIGKVAGRGTVANWRRNPSAVTDSGGQAAALAAAMSAGGNSPFFYVDTAITRTLTFDIPAFAQAGMVVWEMPADDTVWTITYEESFDAGTTYSAPASVSTIQPSTNRIVRLQKKEFAAGPARRVRLKFSHNGTVSPAYFYGGRWVRNLAFFEFDAHNNHDYILWIGDSISEISARHFEAQTVLKSLYGRDVCLFNEGVAGWNIGSVESNLAAILARHPHARHCVLMIGTNNVTSLRPFSGASQSALDAVKTSLANICNALKNAGIQIHLARIPYANYTVAPLVNGTANEENGAKPFNEAIIDKFIAQYSPHLYDNGKGVLDPYQFLRDNPHLLTFDSAGIHPYHFGGRLLGRYLLTRLGSALWGNYVATFPNDSATASAPGAREWVRISFGPAWTVSSASQSIYNRTLSGLYDNVEGLTWNNIQGNATGTTSGLINIDGERTGISLNITTAFSGVTGNGVTNVATNGLDTPYIEAAKLSFAFTNAGVTASMTIGGLSVGTTYKVTIFGSHDGSTTENVTYTETVNAASAVLNARDNLTTTVTLTGLLPNGSGQLILTVTGGAGLGYINVLEIQRQ